MLTINVRNVNEALQEFIRRSKRPDRWRTVSPRGIKTFEYSVPVVTAYYRPDERVLFCPERDANPFFHFFESLWILDGREDVEFLAQFNPQMRSYSDDGVRFHAAYGQRLRGAFEQDQLLEAVNLLKRDKSSRQVVLQIWDVDYDLGFRSKDIPCNDMVFLKIRDGQLNMTVLCRSNDILWGAYGTNAVQFSMLQEFIARAVGVGIGTLYQLSDSYHYYPDSDVWSKIKDVDTVDDRYKTDLEIIRPYPLFKDMLWRSWLLDLNATLKAYDDAQSAAPNVLPEDRQPFFMEVSDPMYVAWRLFKGNSHPDKNTRITLAFTWLEEHCKASDWRTACQEWLYRRRHQTLGTDDVISTKSDRIEKYP